MSFNFSWDSAFSPSFLDKAKTILETALNKGNTPALIVGKIEVRELDMGVIPPTLTLLEIGDLQPDRFRGIFRLGYAGDAHLVVGARVQANPLSPSPSPFPLTTTPLAAHRPLLVPMALRLSNLKLRAIVVLVVSKQKGITLVFKNDPLESLEVSSTFDSIGVLKGFIQREIEGQLREMFREDLPGIIHTLSQQWFTGEAAAATGSSNVPFTSNLDSVVGRPSSGLSPPPPSSSSSFNNNSYSPPSSPPSAHSIPEPLFPPPSQPIPQRSAPRRAPASSPSNRHLSPLASSPTATSTFPDLEQYDPTYGLRPEGVPTHSVVTGLGLGRRWERNRGLGHFVDGSADGGEEGIDGQEGDEGYELVGYEEGDGEGAAGGSYYDHNGDIDSTPPRREYETIPAVGGGTVTRPRVYLSQSFIRPPESNSGGGGGGGSSVWGGGGWESPSSGSAAASGSTTTARVSTAPTITRNDSWRNSSIGGEMGRGGASSPSPAPRMVAGRRNTGSIGPGGSQPFAFPPSSSSSRPGVARYDSSLPSNGQRPSTPSYPSSHTTPTRPSKTLQHSNSSPPGQFPLHHHQAHFSSSSLNPSTSNHSASTHNTPPLSHSLSTTPSHSSNSISTPPSSFPSSSSNQPHQRSPSTSQGLPEIISHLSMLSISNQTLSPYTREHAHIAVRSQPQIFRSNSLIGPGDGSYSSSSSSFLPPPPGGGPRKARRKRIHRLGGGAAAAPNESNSVSPESMPPTPSNSPPQPPSEWDYDSISVVGERLHHQQQQQQQGMSSSSVASRSGAGALRSRPRLTPKASYGFPSTVPAPKGWESGGGFSGRFKSSVVKT